MLVSGLAVLCSYENDDDYSSASSRWRPSELPKPELFNEMKRKFAKMNNSGAAYITPPPRPVATARVFSEPLRAESSLTGGRAVSFHAAPSPASAESSRVHSSPVESNDPHRLRFLGASTPRRLWRQGF
ncbi:unnamed protein product [Soboliphyme baturini]|uniref:Uncharacterized protein n=1 Tax=Soboliphyme baturini TaxID=241478 RepID=A0A183IGB1_9BILA|nr:unnamed protein product [Soboliphyme baturini]